MRFAEKEEEEINELGCGVDQEENLGGGTNLSGVASFQVNSSDL